MSSTSPADEHKSEAKIPSTPIVKLADFLKEEFVNDGSSLELDSNPPKEPLSMSRFEPATTTILAVMLVWVNEKAIFCSDCSRVVFDGLL